jgi:hypothetical protein
LEHFLISRRYLIRPSILEFLWLSSFLLKLLFCPYNVPSLFSSVTTAFYALAQLVEPLRYKPEFRGFDSRWFHWDFSLTQRFRQHCDPGVVSASNRNEYQEYFLGVKAAPA